MGLNFLAALPFALELGAIDSLYLGMVSAIDVAKRALASLMKALATACGVAMSLNRDSADKDIRIEYRKLSRKVHPDRAALHCTDPWKPKRKVKKHRFGVPKVPCIFLIHVFC